MKASGGTITSYFLKARMNELSGDEPMAFRIVVSYSYTSWLFITITHDAARCD